MEMSRTWNRGLVIMAVVLAALILCRSLRLLNAVLYRLGGFGILIALAALVYTFIRRSN